MTYEELKADIEEANLNDEFYPGQWPPDEDLIKWLIEKYDIKKKDA